MSSYTIDSTTINLSEILSTPFTENNFKLIDYLYDPCPADPDDYLTAAGAMILKSITSRKNSVFLFEITLNVDTEAFFNSPIDGYVIRVCPEDDTTSYYQQVCYFSDDFEGIIDIGELDTTAIKAALSTAKTMLTHETALGESSIGTVSTEVNASYVNLDAGNDFSTLAKSMVTQGRSPTTELNLTMPTFALPSAKTSFGSVTHSSTPYAGALSTVSRLSYPYTGFPNGKISLSTQREAAQQDETSAESAYALASSLPHDGSSPNPGTEIVLGRIYKYTSSFFVSKRKFEIPRSYLDNGLRSSARVKIAFKPFILDENLIGEDGLSYHPSWGDDYSKDITAERDGLFSAKNPPSVRIIHTTPGKVSYEVNRGDPVINTCIVMKTFYNPMTGQHTVADTAYSQQVKFTSVNDVVTKVNEDCHNVSPIVPFFTVASYVNSEISLTNTTVSKSFINPLHSGPSREDTTVITGYNDLAGLNIEVTNIPADVQWVRLYREDMSLSTSAENRNKHLIRSATAGWDTREFSFLDTDVVHQRRYRYYAICTRSSSAMPRNIMDDNMLATSFGSVGIVYEDYQAANDDVVDRVAPGSSKLFEINISHYGSVFTTGAAHSFSVNMTAIDTDFSYFIESLRRESLLDVYLEQLSSMSDHLSTIAAFVVERVNRKTGDRTTLTRLAYPNEIYTDTNPDFSAVDGFTYIFKLCLVNPASYITATSPGETDSDRLASLAAISSAFTASTGITPSSELTDPTRTSSGVISESQTGRDTSVTVLSDISSTKITTLTGMSAYIAGMQAFKLSWSVPGPLENHLQSFIINCSLNGVALAPRTVDVMLTDDNSNYAYYDFEYFYEVGTKSYTVTPFFNDYSLGPSSSPVTTILTATVEPALLGEIDVVPMDAAIMGGLKDDFGFGF